jgi:DNA-binding transcriptional LysR family regulator
VEQREIEIFLTLAEELHFGRAAQRLHVSTARVSQTVRKLERRIGVPLFERTSRHVALTPVGRQLRDDLHPAYHQIRDGLQRAISAGREVRGVLRVGFMSAPSAHFLLEVAARFHARYPDCDVQVRDNKWTSGLTQLLRADELDMLLAVLPVCEPGITVGPVLLRTSRVLVVSSGHPFAGRVSICMEDLARDQHLRPPPAMPDYWYDALVPKATPGGRAIRRGPTFTTVEEMIALVGAGKGVLVIPALTSRYYVRPDVTYVPIRDAPPIEWALVWRTAAETGRIRALAQTAQDVSQAGWNPGAPHLTG